ncbi:GST1 [Symbiodinium pilosum]|uniref:GST1 protein n=1 Tax=Symbiodinium pilosum TaxID=2952 RepID=A0A812J8Z4_SYMPI|nr:GST1 [Symbiodinium pilosum]
MGSSLSCFEGFGPPAKPKGKLVFKYFDMAGRGEVIRLALTLGQYSFQDLRLKGDEWEAKEKKAAPYHQLPVLLIDGKPLAQTKAILRYLGKVTAFNGRYLYPSDPLVAAKVDEIMDAFDDLWILLAPTYRIANQQQKEAARQRLFAPGGEAAAMLEIFECTLAGSTNGYVVPQAGLSVADLMYFSFLCVVRSGFMEGLGPELLKSYPSIMKHKELIAAIPEVLRTCVGFAELSLAALEMEATYPEALDEYQTKELSAERALFLSSAMGDQKPQEKEEGDEAERPKAILNSRKRPRASASHVSWDEANLAEHDKERGTRQKIEEPPTPFVRSPASISEDEAEAVPPAPEAESNPLSRDAEAFEEAEAPLRGAGSS